MYRFHYWASLSLRCKQNFILDSFLIVMSASCQVHLFVPPITAYVEKHHQLPEEEWRSGNEYEQRSPSPGVGPGEFVMGLTLSFCSEWNTTLLAS